MRELLEEVMKAEDVSQSEKEQYFFDRTNKHIALVKAAAEKIANASPEFKEFNGTELVQRAEMHDASKFQEPEYTPYLDLTWNKFKGIEEADPRINQATLHHITTNPHHPEYGTTPEKGVPTDASNMKPIDIAEMIADWQAMSEELGTNTVRQWYDQNKGVKWTFTPEQEELIYKLIAIFDKGPEESVNESHSRSKCMNCSKPPVKEVKWAEGMAHAWFCDEHYDSWMKEHSGDVNYVKEVKDGEASEKFADNPNPNIWKTK